MRPIQSVVFILVTLATAGCGSSDRAASTPSPAPASPVAATSAAVDSGAELAQYADHNLTYMEHDHGAFVLAATERNFKDGTITEMQKQVDDADKGKDKVKQLELPDDAYTLDADVEQFEHVIIRGKAIKKVPADASPSIKSVE